MHYREITRLALEKGLLQTRGVTPEMSMYAQILTEIDRQVKRGEQPRFTREGKGQVGLRSWRKGGLSDQIQKHNREVQEQLHRQLQTMKPNEFEELIGALLGKLGFEEIEVTTPGGDGGIDVRGTLVVGSVIRTRMAVQVKRWKSNVQRPIVQQMRGSLGAHEQGLIITTSDFAGGARTEAGRSDATPVALMNGKDLVSLLVENEIGVSRTQHYLIELGDEDEA